MTEQLHALEENLDLGIVLPDGTRLSARFWLPQGSENSPVPAILEYLPYRKSDGTAARDDIMHPYFAERGYACLRVDARGCGDSEGLFEDEYSEQELQDGVDIIHWIAAQPWCTGKVGMQGISWGGFNSLQIAARNPSALKAVITIGSTVDRFADDIHYKGGVQLSENIGWAATAMSWFSMPPDPAIVGDRWRDMWLHRLENTPFLISRWLKHQNRDDYWKHGSVCEDFSSITAAVLAMGGLHDGYRNTMTHLAENITAPVKAIAGPWSHKYPHISTIEPSIGYLQEALRWWDHWLKEENTTVENDPAYRAYMMHSIKPSASIKARPGHWVKEQLWPSPSIRQTSYGLGPNTLGKSANFSATIGRALEVGNKCGEYFPFGFGPGELPEDQTQDDQHSLCFETEAQCSDLGILGAPSLKLTLSSDQKAAQLVARLSDVRPDGSAMLISLGLLNLRHRNSFEHPENLSPGEPVEIDLKLDQCAYHLPAGHRLRLALSNSYWPYAWPEGKNANLTITAGELTIPTRSVPDSDEWEFEPPYSPAGRKCHALEPALESKQRLTENNISTLTIIGDHGKTEDLHSGIITSSKTKECWTIDLRDPASASALLTWDRSFERDSVQVSTKLSTDMWADETHFYVSQILQAWQNTECVFEKKFEDKVPRYD